MFPKIHDAILNGNKEHYQFNDLELELLFFNKMFRPKHGHFDKNYWEDHGQEYRLNSHGYRSDEFSSDTDILFVGCSQTYGIGLPEEYLWPTLVGNTLNLKYSNLGIPGGSTTSLVNTLFAYFKEFGNPKIIVCYFPDVARILLPISKNFLIGEHTDTDKDHQNYCYLDHDYLRNGYEVKAFSKKPHNVKDVIPEDVPYWMAMQSIHILEQYCRATGIQLVWSIWDEPVLNAIKKMKEKDNSFFEYMYELQTFDWSNGDCHKDLHDKDPSIYSIATDDWHWGSHRHQHVADQFVDKIKSLS